jgi:autotransporter-associated beta strand protein
MSKHRTSSSAMGGRGSCRAVPPRVRGSAGASPSLRAIARAVVEALEIRQLLAQSIWAYPGGDGHLLYKTQPLGDHVEDYSTAGYKGGTLPIPDVPVRATVSPVAGDDTSAIQAAINSVAAMPLDANGFRGAVLLNPGTYDIGTQINITASGVVLRGSGQNQTLIHATGLGERTIINLNGSGTRSAVSGTTHTITDKYVPVGAISFTVDSTANLHVGDQVIVHRPSTQQWINDMGMNLLDNPWTPGSKDINMDRTITHIDGNVITIDAPITQALELKYTDASEGPNQIYVYTANGRLNNVGVEYLGGYSDYNPAIVDTDGDFTDEDHPWTFINIDGSTNAWARNITSQYFGYACVFVTGSSKYVTVADSQCLDPVSQITGGRRYSFNLDDSAMVLFRNCYTREGRHDYVEGSTVVGPNVFVDSRSDNTHADIGPHHRYSTAALWDNIKGGSINIQDRGNSGTGHGHAGANQVIWNSTAGSFIVQSPIAAQNWLIGSNGTINAGGGVGFHTPGLIDSSGSGSGHDVAIRSLYYQQLAERMAYENFVLRESRVGDSDNYVNDGASDTNIADATWKSQVQSASGFTAVGFDTVANGQAVPFTFNFPLDAGMHVVGASLSLGLKSAGGITTSDKIYVEHTSRVYTWADLGVTAPTTTAGAVTIDLSKLLAAMQDGKLNIAVAGNTAIDWATLNLQTASTTLPRTTTLTAAADAYVQDGTNAGTNFGSATTLTTKLDTTNNNRESYVKFDLSALTPGTVVRATVRLVPTTVNYSNPNSFGSGKGAVFNQLYLVSDNGWTENGINWNNRPAAGAMLDEFVSYANAPMNFDVTALVKAALAGDKKLSLKFLSITQDTNGQLTFGARENSDPDLRPQIIIQSFDSAVAPEADTMVQDGTSANTNFGTSQGLGTKKDTTNENRESYLRFDLSSFTGPLVAASLRLMPTYDGYAYVTNNIDLVNSNTWSETTTTWNNKPAVGTNLGSFAPRQSTPTKLNVTTQAANSLAGDKKLSLHVASNTTSANGLTLFGAREHADPTFTPLLVFKNLVPQITTITNQKTGSGTSTVAAWFGVWDAETAAGSLALSATSSNPTLLPNSNITFGGSGADRTVTLTPAANQFGTANVTVTVADAQGQTAQTTFQLTVTTALTVNGDQDEADQPDVIRLVRSGTFLNIYRNDPTNPILHLDYATAPAIAVNALGGDDTVTVDYSGGNPVPANGLTIDGGDGSDTLNIVNTAGNDTVSLAADSVSFGTGATFTYSDAEIMSLGLGSGQDTLIVSGNAGVSTSALNLSIAGLGKLTMGAGSTLPDFTDLNVGNATFDLNGQNQTIDALTGSGGTVLNNGASAATLTLGDADGSGTFSGTLANGTGGLSLMKVGTGTQTLSGSSSFTGATTVDAGALRITNAAALGATSGGTTINGGSSTGRVEFSGSITVAEPFTLGNRTGGGGGNFAAHLLNVSGNNTLTGAITLATGGSYWTIQSNAGKLTVAGNLTNANTSNARTLFLGGAGDGEVSGAILQTNASVTQLNKEDTGVWTLSGANTYSGATSANNGTLRLATTGTLGNGGGVNVGPSGLLDIASGRATALKIPSMLIASGGTMDLQDNDLIVGSATPPDTLLGYIRDARNGGAWDGTGLTSSVAKNNPQHNTTLGLLTGAEFTSAGGTGTFSGQSYDGSDSLIKYTYYGDSDFNGRVNFDDYVRTDNGFNNHLSGWLNGDFDGNGTVNFDDYVLIDLAFNTQSGTLGRPGRAGTGGRGIGKR